MSARKRRAPTDAPATDGSSVTKGADAADQDTTGSCAEVNSLPFDPNRVLLRRVFFLDPDKTRYISVGYYPARNYQPLVEIGSPKVRPILLKDQHVKTLAEHLPAQVDVLWRDEFYNVRDGEFAMHSATPYKTAILALGEKKNRKAVFLKLPELCYLTHSPLCKTSSLHIRRRWLMLWPMYFHRLIQSHLLSLLPLQTETFCTVSSLKR